MGLSEQPTTQPMTATQPGNHSAPEQSRASEQRRVGTLSAQQAGWLIWAATGVCFLCLFPALFNASAGNTLAEDRGITGLLQALERLPVVASVLHTTAHPDDEDGSLLTYLSRGVHARTVLLSATRGEGGQNLIGSEKSEAMGLLRTGELLAACQYYGAELRFTRAYEFGYSKTAAETLGKWGHQEILADFVRVIRQERPDIIITRFHGTPQDRHGHHQAAGILTREAFRAAADPNRFLRQIAHGLRPWQARKLYQDQFRFFSPPTKDWNLRLDLGSLDPILGRSYHELAMAGLTKQRSQGLATVIPRKGTVEATFNIVDRTIPVAAKETGFFDGIDTSIRGIAARAGDEANSYPALKTALADIQQHITAALSAFTPRHPEATAPHVLAGLSRLRQLIRQVEASNLSDEVKYELLFVLRRKERDFLDAARLALNIELDVRADDPTIIPGQVFTVTVGVYNRGREAVELTALNLSLPPGWQARQTEGALQPLSGAQQTQIKFSVKVAADAAPTQPYWFRRSERDNRYQLRSEKDHRLPFSPPEIVAMAECRAWGVKFELSKPAHAPHSDPTRGVQFRQLQVVPALSVELEPHVAVVPQSPTDQQRFWRVRIVNNAPHPVQATVQLRAPTSWRVSPRSATVHLSRKSESATVAFHIAIPGGLTAQQARVKAVARFNDREYSDWYQVVSHPDIWTRHLYHRAESRVQVLDLKVAPDLTVGYILGTQDEVPGAIKELGVKLDLLDEEDLAFGDLNRFDCIIAGVRAYNSRDDLRRYNQRLLEYVHHGGVYIVQYNTARGWNPAEFTPYPAKFIRFRNDRITVEESPVEILEPDHPVFNQPNKITVADFDGWVQERGLYFWNQWDSRYRPLLSGHDPGEKPKRGGWVEAKYGQGLYVYTAYAWFRQLPAGVSGAYRLFANLISLPKTRQESNARRTETR